MLTPEQGALTQLFAATASDVEEKDMKSVIPSISVSYLLKQIFSLYRAGYLVPIAQRKSLSNIAADKDGRLGRQFWNLCETLVKKHT